MSRFWQRFYTVSLISTFHFIAQTTLFDRLMKFTLRYSSNLSHIHHITYCSQFISLFSITEFRSVGIYTGGSSHIFTLLSSPLLDVTMLRSKASPRTFHYEPQSYAVNRHRTMLCCNRFG